MPLTTVEHLDNLVRHIRLVQEATLLLGKRLIAAGREPFGRDLIKRGFVHDASKFHGIEWEFLHQGPDVPQEELRKAVVQHVTTNDHHPEYWGGIEKMPEIAVAEMVCDWYARSQEFGTGLREWFTQKASVKFRIRKNAKTWKRIQGFIDILLDNAFKVSDNGTA